MEIIDLWSDLGKRMLSPINSRDLSRRAADGAKPGCAGLLWLTLRVPQFASTGLVVEKLAYTIDRVCHYNRPLKPRPFLPLPLYLRAELHKETAHASLRKDFAQTEVCYVKSACSRDHASDAGRYCTQSHRKNSTLGSSFCAFIVIPLHNGKAQESLLAIAPSNADPWPPWWPENASIT